jgi:hypothetical protein
MPGPQDALTRELELVGRALSYPATPSLAGAVAARLAPPPRPAPAWGFAGVALAAAVVVLAVVAGTIAPARDAMADIFDRINIFEVDDVPEDLSAEIDGQAVTVEAAERRLGRPVLLPTGEDAGTEAPVKILLQEFSGSPLVSVALLFEPDNRTPYILFQTNANAGKGLGPGAEAERLSGVGDDQAYWLSGLRIVQLYDPSEGLIQESQRRTDTNTLLWSEDGFVYRIEGDLSREEAIAIAQSLR